MTDTHRFSVSVAAAITRDDGKMLAIQRRDNAHWEPPGGVVDPGETLVDALVREVREETGYTVKAGPLTGVYQNLERNIMALVFGCSIVGGEPRLSDESASLEWLSAEEVVERMEEAYSARLLDAGDDSAVSIRAHDGRRLLG